MTMVGRTYLERGEPVTLVTPWGPGRGDPDVGVIWVVPPRKGGPRNVAIRRGDGTVVVRPFRGLRLPKNPLSGSGES